MLQDSSATPAPAQGSGEHALEGQTPREYFTVLTLGRWPLGPLCEASLLLQRGGPPQLLLEAQRPGRCLFAGGDQIPAGALLVCAPASPDTSLRVDGKEAELGRHRAALNETAALDSVGEGGGSPGPRESHNCGFSQPRMKNIQKKITSVLQKTSSAIIP